MPLRRQLHSQVLSYTVLEALALQSESFCVCCVRGGINLHLPLV